MLILVMMLLIGLFAGVWGFLMCFFPARWDKLTEGGWPGLWFYSPVPEKWVPCPRVLCEGGCDAACSKGLSCLPASRKSACAPRLRVSCKGVEDILQKHLDPLGF